VLAKTRFQIRGRDQGNANAAFVPFTAETRMSGVDIDGRQIRKGAKDAVERWVQQLGGSFSPVLSEAVNELARRGSTPLVVADRSKVLGVVEFKDVVKGGIRERFAELRRLGIKTIMVTGDNPSSFDCFRTPGSWASSRPRQAARRWLCWCRRPSRSLRTAPALPIRPRPPVPMRANVSPARSLARGYA